MMISHNLVGAQLRDFAVGTADFPENVSRVFALLWDTDNDTGRGA